MHFNKSELTIIYNSKKSIDKKVLAIAQGISKKINRQDIHEVRLSNTLFRMALEKLGLNGKEVMDKSHPIYKKDIKGTNPDIDSAYYFIMNNPELLKAPLVLYKEKAIFCKTHTDVLKI